MSHKLAVTLVAACLFVPPFSAGRWSWWGWNHGSCWRWRGVRRRRSGRRWRCCRRRGYRRGWGRGRRDWRWWWTRSFAGGRKGSGCFWERSPGRPRVGVAPKRCVCRRRRSAWPRQRRSKREELRSGWSVRGRSAPAAQWLRVAELIIGVAPVQVVVATGMAEDGEAAVTMFTLAIGALGSDSAGATEMYN